jgi:hypothetical protein
MFALDEQDGAGALAVETGGDVQDCFFDDFLDFRIGNWGGFGERVDGAAGFDCFEEGGGGGHVCGVAELTDRLWWWWLLVAIEEGGEEAFYIPACGGE